MRPPFSPAPGPKIENMIGRRASLPDRAPQRRIVLPRSRSSSQNLDQPSRYRGYAVRSRVRPAHSMRPPIANPDRWRAESAAPRRPRASRTSDPASDIPVQHHSGTSVAAGFRAESYPRWRLLPASNPVLPKKSCASAIFIFTTSARVLSAHANVQRLRRASAIRRNPDTRVSPIPAQENANVNLVLLGFHFEKTAHMLVNQRSFLGFQFAERARSCALCPCRVAKVRQDSGVLRLGPGIDRALVER